MEARQRRLLKLLLLYPLLALVFIELFLQLAAFALQLTGREQPQEWATDNTRILAVGDSNTYGLYLEEQDSWPSQLENIWNSQHSNKIEILNFGYPGTNTYRALDTYEALLQTFQPEIVLLMIGVNDYLNPYQGKNRQAAVEAHSPLMKLLNKSRIYKFIGLISGSSYDENKVDAGKRVEFTPGEDKGKTSMAIHNWKQGRTEGEDNAEYIYVGDKKFKVNGHIANSKPDKSLIKVKENILELAALSNKHNSQLVLLTYPASQWFYQPTNREIRLAANESSLPLIDVAAHFKTFCPKSLECPDVFFAPHDLHPRASGYKLAAEYIEQELAKLYSKKASSMQTRLPGKTLAEPAAELEVLEN